MEISTCLPAGSSSVSAGRNGKADKKENIWLRGEMCLIYPLTLSITSGPGNKWGTFALPPDVYLTSGATSAPDPIVYIGNSLLMVTTGGDVVARTWSGESRAATRDRRDATSFQFGGKEEEEELAAANNN